jgi:FkbM family methyltransferase
MTLQTTRSRAHYSRVQPHERELIGVALGENAHFLYPRDDVYWRPDNTTSVGLYEPEIDWLLRRAIDRPYALVDCGANMGYWSIVASSAPYGRHQAIAVEASASNYAILTTNARANNGRFATLHRAVHDTSDQRVRLFGKRHFGKSLRADWHLADSDQFEDVDTISIDDIARLYLADRQYPPLLKLDVEGAEIEAMQGAERLIGEGALLIFEDHGKQSGHLVSRFVLAQTSLDAWWLSPNQELRRITTIEQIAEIKREPRMGYNFFACERESPWASLFGLVRSPIRVKSRSA